MLTAASFQPASISAVDFVLEVKKIWEWKIFGGFGVF